MSKTVVPLAANYWTMKRLNVKNKEDMPANVMLIAVLIMAVIGVSYFLIQDKKEENYTGNPQ